jgi:hypothetical protein
MGMSFIIPFEDSYHCVMKSSQVTISDSSESKYQILDIFLYLHTIHKSC